MMDLIVLVMTPNFVVVTHDFLIFLILTQDFLIVILYFI